MINTIAAAIELANSILEKLPSYEQRKREKFFKLRTKINEELKKPDKDKIDGLIDDLYDDLGLLFNSFRKEIETKGLPPKNV